MIWIVLAITVWAILQTRASRRPTWVRRLAAASPVGRHLRADAIAIVRSARAITYRTDVDTTIDRILRPRSPGETGETPTLPR